MSNPKLKSENYQNFGGINTRSSPYVLTPFEFLDLTNLDFQTPGSLSQRWGSTQYIGQTFPGQINSLFEFARLDGSSYVIQSYSGGIFYGATTGQTQGLSFTLQSATLSLYWYLSRTAHGNGPGFIPEEGGQDLAVDFLGNPAVYAGSSLFFVNPVSTSDGRYSYAVTNNYLFMADGKKFVKFDGVTTSPVGLIPPVRPFGITAGVGGASVYYSPLSGSSDFIGLGFTGFYAFYMSYVNNRGFEGPLWPMHILPGGSFINGGTLSGLAGTFLAFRMPISTPLQFGISAINQYVYWSATVLPQYFNPNQDPDFWGGYGGLMALVSQTPASGSTITYVALGTTVGGQTLMLANGGQLAPTTGYQPLGLTLINSGPYTTTSEFNVVQFAPQFLETFQNRLFLSGFSGAPSTVWFSDIGEPEGYRPDFNFEVRTNDGDTITCIRAYQSKLYILKSKSFHVLTGDNPSNFVLQQVTDQYGCINNRCAVPYNDLLIFLDRSGLVLFNGAGTQSLSDPKIKSIFDRMNHAAAVTEACAVHDKLRTQIIFAIPIDGSSTNNIAIVYDYSVGGFTTYKGVNISSLAKIQGRNQTKNAFYGDYSGRINWFGSSFLADNGSGFTASLKTRFLHDMGDSTQKMFRRLYLNADAPGSTTTFHINFFQDYGASVVGAATLVLSQFQSRIDFGVSAKSLAFEMAAFQTAVPLKIHGFTIESRMQRRV